MKRMTLIQRTPKQQQNKKQQLLQHNDKLQQKDNNKGNKCKHKLVFIEKIYKRN